MRRRAPARSAVFLDRDGVLNFPPTKARYVTCWEEFRFLPGVFAALRNLKAAGRKLILVSNQAGVGRKLFSNASLARITRNMLKEIRAHGGRIDAVYYCTHVPERRCGCRKPKPGMLRRAARRFSLNLAECVVVGDNATDIEMARSAGCRTILVLTGVTARKEVRRLNPPPDFVAPDLSAAAERILQMDKASP